MSLKTLSAVCLIAISFACRTKKQAVTPVAAVPAETLDTVHIVAGKEPVKKTYRASNTLPNDILHTKLDVSFDWAASRMNGTATLQVKPWFYPQAQLVLNARGMEIRGVEVFEVVPPPTDKLQSSKPGKKPQSNVSPPEQLHKLDGVTHDYDGDSLRIRFGREFFRHEHYYVTISYLAKPNELPSKGGSAAITDDKGLYFVNPSGENPYKMTQLWTQGETQSSSVWFPTVDSPNEKMTQEIIMHVDDKYVTLSNGVLVSSQKEANGMRADHWKLESPHAPYLAMMAVGEFVKVTDEPWNGKEVSYYVEKEYADHAKGIFGETRDMIDFYSRVLNVPYEWGKYAQIVARDYVSGAMENTSATLHGDFMVYQTTRELADGKKGTAVIAHELFHQWFGDLVTTESWSNLPLNESFATYGEYLWEEHRNGRDAADEHGWQSRMGYLQSQEEVDLIRFEYEDKEDMFDAFSYNKGGQVLHMLRKAVGDEAFFSSLHKYLTDNKYKPVEIHHLRLAFEEVTGRDMNWFFSQWFLNKGRPKLEVQKRYDTQKKTVELIVTQKQDLKKFPLYTLPLAVDVYAGNEVKRHMIVIDDVSDTFLLQTPQAPKLVNFDGERQLLADISYPKTDEEYIFQYTGAPLFMDRMEALQKMERRINDSTGFFLFCQAALKDRNPTIRRYVISKLEKSAPAYAADLKSTLTQVFLGDSANRVKALALSTLNTRFMNDAEVMNLTEQGLKSQSYAINAEALKALMKRDPARAMQSARQFEPEHAGDIIFALAALYATHGSDAQVPFFRESIRYVNGFDLLPFCSLYGKLAQRCNLPVNVVKVASDLELIGRGAMKYTRFAAGKAIKELYAAYEAKETSLSQQVESLQRSGKPTAGAEQELAKHREAKAALKAIYDRSRS